MRQSCSHFWRVSFLAWFNPLFNTGRSCTERVQAFLSKRKTLKLLLPAEDGQHTKGALAQGWSATLQHSMVARQTQRHKRQKLPADHTSSAPIAFRTKAMLAVKDSLTPTLGLPLSASMATRRSASRRRNSPTKNGA
jgi:hypothetical protein